VRPRERLAPRCAHRFVAADSGTVKAVYTTPVAQMASVYRPLLYRGHVEHVPTSVAKVRSTFMQ
jgi:hypothetical protein